MSLAHAVRRLLLLGLVSACSGGGGGAGGAGGTPGKGGTTGTGSGTAGTGGGTAGTGSGAAGTGSGTAGTAGGGGGVAGSSIAGRGGNSAGRGGSAGGSPAGAGGGAGAGGMGGGAGASGEITVYVSGSSTTISVLGLDVASGALTPRGTVAGGTSPTYLAFDPGKRFLYAGNGGQGRVTTFGIGPTGALARVGDTSTAGMGYMASVTHVSVHPTGNWVLAAHFDSGHVAVLPVGGNGLAGAPVDIQRPADEAHQIVSDASGRHVFVPCRSGNVIAQYNFDAVTGRLSPASPAQVQAEAGAGPRHIAFHPNQRFAYVINELNGTITSYAYDANAGTLSAPQSMSSVPSAVNERSSAHVVVHPSGEFVYTSNRNNNSIAMFSVNATSGRLTAIGHETGAGAVRTPRDFGIEPGGRFLLVANQGTNSVLVFRIDPIIGLLTRVGDAVTVPSMPQFAGALVLPQ